MKIPYVIMAMFVAVGVLPAAPRPNIVFIMADDLGYADVGWHGSRIRTPNLDKLALAGARLESHYGMPVCTPSRCALMTGRYPIRYGRQYNVLRPNSKVGLLLGEKLLPQFLQDSGYETAHLGKWHLGEFDQAYWPDHRGFGHTYGPRFDQRNLHHILESGDAIQRDGKPCTDRGSVTGLLSLEAERLIARRDKSKPLFMYLAFRAPHAPLECPPEYSAPYKEMGPERSLYAGMVTEMDEGVGRVVRAVEKAGMRDNTLFVFSSDNGGLTSKVAAASNGTLRGGKASLYEGGVRVAAFASWPGRIPAGSVVREPIHMVDWLPTMVNLAGASPEYPKPLDGKDIWSVIAAGKPTPHSDILINTVGRKGAIRAGDWKLVRNGNVAENDGDDGDKPKMTKQEARRMARSAPDAVELFNLAADPSEAVNVAAGNKDRVRELTALLDRYGKEAVAPILRPEQMPKTVKTE